MNDLQQELLNLAEAIAQDSYGCGLERLDPEQVNWYLQRVNADNLDGMASDLAADAWQAY
jgi:hypothetical protein